MRVKVTTLSPKNIYKYIRSYKYMLGNLYLSVSRY